MKIKPHHRLITIRRKGKLRVKRILTSITTASATDTNRPIFQFYRGWCNAINAQTVEDEEFNHVDDIEVLE